MKTGKGCNRKRFQCLDGIVYDSVDDVFLENESLLKEIDHSTPRTPEVLKAHKRSFCDDDWGEEDESIMRNGISLIRLTAACGFSHRTS